MTMHHPQRGAAFLYVMVMFMVASLIVVGLLATAARELDRTQHFINETQAIQYALGAETFARQMLLDNAHAWRGPYVPFAITGGTVVMEAEDMRGRFNINSLLGNDPQAIAHFSALCAGVGIAEKSITDALAEIARRKPPPPAPGTAAPTPVWMADTSELADGILSMDDYAKLSPYITALPADAFVINVNAAADPVLLAYLDQLEQLEIVHDMAKNDKGVSIDQLAQIQNQDKSFAVDSNSYRLHITVTLNGQVIKLHSLIMSSTEEKRMTVVARTWGDI